MLTFDDDKCIKSLLFVYNLYDLIKLKFMACFTVYLLCRFVVPESPRWLLCKGRVAEVKVILKKAAAFNGRELPDNLDKILKPPPNDQDTSGGVFELFGSKYLRRVSFCFLCIWFTMNLVYYGLVLNMNSLGGDIYLNSVSIYLR